MATLKCLACGQDNKADEEWCRSCSSSLNLRLCTACEAVNGATADRCHNCGAGFEQETPRAVATAPVEELVLDEAPALRSLPAMRRSEDTFTASPSRGRGAALWTLAIALVAGSAYAYYHYELPGVPAAQGVIAATVAPTRAPVVAAPALAPAPAVEAKPVEAPPVAQPKIAKAPPPPAPAPVITVAKPVMQNPPKTANPPVTQAEAPAEGKRVTSRVTHTRAGAEPVATRSESTAAVVSAPAPIIAPEPVAAPAASRRARVTHTKGPDPEEAAAVAATAPAVSPAPIRKEMNPSACAPAVAALGLCASK